MEQPRPAPAPELAALLSAVRFAAEKHRYQKRKGEDASPYINHPIEVAETLARCKVATLETLQAAILHDTIEDTETTGAELEREFGALVRRLVEEVTDDKKLPKQTRKELQIKHAARLSPGAKQIKVADKTCNVRDVTHAPPAGWSVARRREYLDWAERVVAGCRGANPELEQLFDQVLAEGKDLLG
ncbi:MAG TPA: HD domain-containing protein [Longimicrobiales bacterium]|nr:HD domain-containing protein [Longimicrobiales bacterium]